MLPWPALLPLASERVASFAVTAGERRGILHVETIEQGGLVSRQVGAFRV